MNDTPNAPIENETEFTAAELSLFARIRTDVIEKLTQHSTDTHTRLLLGSAAELLDAAAEKAAMTAPGMKVVQLSFLAKRLESIALSSEDT